MALLARLLLVWMVTLSDALDAVEAFLDDDLGSHGDVGLHLNVILMPIMMMMASWRPLTRVATPLRILAWFMMMTILAMPIMVGGALHSVEVELEEWEREDLDELECRCPLLVIDSWIMFIC